MAEKTKGIEIVPMNVVDMIEYPSEAEYQRIMDISMSLLSKDISEEGKKEAEEGIGKHIRDWFHEAAIKRFVKDWEDLLGIVKRYELAICDDDTASEKKGKITEMIGSLSDDDTQRVAEILQFMKDSVL